MGEHIEEGRYRYLMQSAHQMPRMIQQISMELILRRIDTNIARRA